MSRIQIPDQKKSKFVSGKVSGWLVRGSLPGNDISVVGIDPGVNFGISVIIKEDVYIYNGKVDTRIKSERAWYSKDVFEFILNLLKVVHPMRDFTAVIEGAAYGKKFGQVQLAEVRNGFFLGCTFFTDSVYVVPPSTIRKMAFGSGDTYGRDEYPQINHNAAAGLGCAMAAMKKIEENRE